MPQAVSIDVNRALPAYVKVMLVLAVAMLAAMY